MASQFINLKSRLLNPYVVFAVWMLCTVWICITQSLAGPQNYNNFLVFRGVFDHLFSSLPLYEPYPLEYGDINHYGPIFAFIIAPFAVLPPWLGMSLWCMSLSLLLYWTVRQLPMPVVLTSLVLWLTLNDFYGACFKQQFNIAVAALVVGALAMIEKRREGWAALFIVIGTFVKIYGIVGLAFFFFVRRKGRFIGYMALWSAMALLLPLLFVSPEYLWSQYAAWAADIVQKNGENMFCAYTNISLVGCVRKISGSPAYSDLLIIVPAMVLFLLSYLRTGQYKHFSYRLTMLASLLLFIVLFSSGSEHSGYVIAALGMGIWWVNFPPPARGRLEWTLLLLALFASFSYNLLPTKFYRGVFVAYALRSLPFFAIWLHCIRRLWREDFAVTDVLLDYKTLPAADEAANEAAESRPARPGDGLDIVCPCYNPAPGFVPALARSYAELCARYPDKRLHLIVVNDGSPHGFGEEQHGALRQAVPDVEIVDIPHGGKGAAIRAGIARSRAPYTIYTDIDMPYTAESMCEVIDRVFAGTDVVIAVRNRSYHSRLSPMRKMMSYGSKLLNRIFLNIRHTDTQGGLKGLSPRARAVMLRTRISDFLFDTEFVVLAARDKRLRIEEVETMLRDGIVMSAMSPRVLFRELSNFFRIAIRL